MNSQFGNLRQRASHCLLPHLRLVVVQSRAMISALINLRRDISACSRTDNADCLARSLGESSTTHGCRWGARPRESSAMSHLVLAVSSYAGDEQGEGLRKSSRNAGGQASRWSGVRRVHPCTNSLAPRRSTRPGACALVVVPALVTHLAW